MPEEHLQGTPETPPAAGLGQFAVDSSQLSTAYANFCRVTGTPEELAKRVKAMRRMGVKQIAVHGGTRTGAPKVIADFAKHVIGKG